jgi:acyl-CoA thioesterase-1
MYIRQALNTKRLYEYNHKMLITVLMFFIYLRTVEKGFIATIGLLIVLLNIRAVPAQQSPQKILFFGDSITAGYGLNPDQAFPALIQQKIDSLELNYTVVNAGLSGETSAGGLRRVDWVLQQGVDIFVLELGGNDGLRGLNLEQTKANLQGIIDKVEAKFPQALIVLAGMEVPPNLGADYTLEFRQMYVELAQQNDVLFIPFVLEGVGGVPKLNLDDQIHPNQKGHKKVAEHVWGYLVDALTSNKTIK